MLRSKFNEVCASNEFQSIALLKRSLNKDRNLTYSRGLSYNSRNKIDLSQKQYSHNHTHSQIGNRYQPENDTKDITLQPGQSSIDAKISLLKQPVYCSKKSKKTKKMLSHYKTFNKTTNRKIQRIEQANDLHITNFQTKRSCIANQSDAIKQEMIQNRNIQVNCLPSQQKYRKNSQSINKLAGKHSRNLTSITSHKIIQFQAQKKHQRLKSSHKRLNSIVQNKIFGGIQSKNILIRQRQCSPRHSNPVGKTICDSKDSQHILKKSSLFLVNFLRLRQRNEQKNEEHPHIGNIANTTGQMKIIASKPAKKLTKTCSKIKHGASKSLSNFLGSGNSYVISPW